MPTFLLTFDLKWTMLGNLPGNVPFKTRFSGNFVNATQMAKSLAVARSDVPGIRDRAEVDRPGILGPSK
jgi:hypothetical protein